MANSFFQECDPDWANRIKLARFRNHNQTWLETIEGQQVSYDDDDDPTGLNHGEPYGFDSGAFADQDDYLDQFGYNDIGNGTLSLSTQSIFV